MLDSPEDVIEKIRTHINEANRTASLILEEFFKTLDSPSPKGGGAQTSIHRNMRNSDMVEHEERYKWLKKI